MEANTNTGADAIMNDGSTFEVEGKVYTFKRLGIKQTMKAISILKDAVAYGYHDLAFMNNLVQTLAAQKKDNVAAIAAMLFGLTDVHDKLFEFVADCLKDSEGKNLTLEDLYNEDKFPMYSVLDLLVAFMSHQDIVSFFMRLLGVMDKLVPKVEEIKNQVTQETKSVN